MIAITDFRVAIIIPVYNEDPEVLSATLTDILTTPYHIILVDDASAPAVTLPAFASNRISLCTHQKNQGQGAAIRTGIGHALSQKFEAVVLFDADGQHQASDLGILLAPIQQHQADVVLGSRFITGATVSMSLARKVILHTGRLTHGLFYGLWLTDAHNGLKALNSTAMQLIKITEPRSAHASELLFEIKRNKLRWQEVPVHILYSDYSIRKGQKWWHAFGIAWARTCTSLETSVTSKIEQYSAFGRCYTTLRQQPTSL